jgi:hypothetical protein
VVPGQPRLRQIGQQHAQRVLRPHLRVAVGAHHAQRRRGGHGGTHQAEQEVESVWAGPLQIVEHQQRARRPRHVGQEPPHGYEEQAPFLPRRQRYRRQRR